ncbi:DUF4369 domain-containing protein [Altibacter sp. HG106]|uniref:DUF4369 domain-containing protein n=1 Tax=Altibacter sp. HG106 TaxID=3023937 RepID=UPI0023509678|nr:DUF4369 domain-containing protein [Altibacter sp. HG106]MDC7996323.1 DUF4369 domain-containing protein [Altibacter sp. HG106]
MIRYVSLLCFLLLFISCGTRSSEEDQMVVSGTVSGLKKGTLLLQTANDSVYVTADSLTINGEDMFELSTTVESPQMYYLYLKEQDGDFKERIPFFGEPGEIRVETSLAKFGINQRISGSESQAILEDYKKLSQRFTDRNLELIEELLIAQKDGKDSLAQALQRQQERNLSSKYLATVNFARNHNDSEVAPYVMLAEAYDIRTKYLDTVYNHLTPRIQNSTYGKKLQKLIASAKENN